MSSTDENTIASITADVVVKAFTFMGGDPEVAAASAKDFTSVEWWIAWQTAQASIVGAVVTAIPGVHLPAIVVDIAFLLHKMAYCCWGIGAIHRCRVEGETDFALILGLWSGVIKEEHLPAVIDQCIGVGILAGIGATALAPSLVGGSASMAVTKGLELTAKGLLKVTSKGFAKAGSKGLLALGQIAGPLAGKIAEKVAVKIAAKSTLTAAAAKAISNAAAGFLPFVGPLVAGAVNIYFVTSIASSANAYYRQKRQATSRPKR